MSETREMKLFPEGRLALNRVTSTQAMTTVDRASCWYQASIFPDRGKKKNRTQVQFIGSSQEQQETGPKE